MSFYEESSIIITPNAYKAGTLYAVVPTSGAADMDVTRATAATRVDENGLVNYAEILGGEEVTNGDGGSTSGWDLAYPNTTLSIDNNNLRATANSSGAYGLSQSLSLDTSKQYIIKATIDVDNASGGTANLRIATTSNLGSGVTTLSTATGTSTTILSPSATTMYIGIVDTADDSSNYVEIDNISVKEVIRDNVPRIDYTGGGCPHILAEPQRENLETTSASGTYGNAPASEILAIAPDGLNTAIRPVPDSAADRYQYTITGGSYSSGYEVTYSWYRKRFSTPVEDNFVGDLKINTLVNCTQVGVTIEIASSINGYDRFSATFSITDGSLNSILRLYFGTVIGDGNSSIAYWGHQLEAGSYPTSYIPTSGSTVTRNQDVFTRDGISSLINDSEGVLFVEMAALADDGTYRTISLNKNSANDEGVRVRFNTTTNTISGLVRDGGSGTAQTTYQVSDTKDFHKVAFKYKSGESELWVDGVKRDTSADTFTLDSLNNLNFNQGTASDIFYGKVKQLQVYPTALSDAELTTLTTP